MRWRRSRPPDRARLRQHPRQASDLQRLADRWAIFSCVSGGCAGRHRESNRHDTRSLRPLSHLDARSRHRLGRRRQVICIGAPKGAARRYNASAAPITASTSRRWRCWCPPARFGFWSATPRATRCWPGRRRRLRGGSTCWRSILGMACSKPFDAELYARSTPLALRRARASTRCRFRRHRRLCAQTL